MLTTRILVLITLWMAPSVSATSAQAALSATPGLPHYAEGLVFLDRDQVEFESARFAALELGQRFRVGDGRAELLFNASGVVCRLA